jgi:hypothetical protein
MAGTNRGMLRAENEDGSFLWNFLCLYKESGKYLSPKDGLKNKKTLRMGGFG